MWYSRLDVEFSVFFLVSYLLLVRIAWPVGGLSFERCFKFLVFITLCSSLPFVVVSLDPQKLFLVLYSLPAMKRFPSVLKNLSQSSYYVVVMVLRRAVDGGNCCFSSAVFNGDADSLHTFMSIFCSYVVFNVLSVYYCSTFMRSFVWVISVIQVCL